MLTLALDSHFLFIRILRSTTVKINFTPINVQQPLLCENRTEISQLAEASENLMTTTVTSQHGSPQNINTSPSIDLQYKSK